MVRDAIPSEGGETDETTQQRRALWPLIRVRPVWIWLIAVVALALVLMWGVRWWGDRPPVGLIQRLPAAEGNLISVVFSADGKRCGAGRGLGRAESGGVQHS